MTLFSKLTFDHSRWQVSRVKQGTLTLPEHLVPHPLQGALNCTRCSFIFYSFCSLSIDLWHRISILDLSAGTLIITGDLNIVDNTCLRDLISKGPKYREPQKFSWKYNFKLIMESVEDYARSWAKQEEVELDTLSEWVKSIKHQLKRRIYMVSRSVNTKPFSIVSRHLTDLHDRFVIVPADKASDNVVFICKTYYSC